MKFLICSDGTPASDNATRLAALIGTPARAQLTLLGIAESPADEEPLRQTLEKQAAELRRGGASEAKIFARAGDPVTQILAETSINNYDLVIVGARLKRSTGPFWQSQRTYEVIKSIEPPVLVAIGESQRLSNFLVCTGGKNYIDDAVRLTGNFAAALGATVTLLHVMAEPPAVYAQLAEKEEDVDALLDSGSELGRNLKAEKQSLEKRGVTARVRIRHGFVIEQVFDEMREGHYQLIVSGSSRARGPLRHYIMGDLTRSILNRASCPVLVARSTSPAVPVNVLSTLWRKLFAAPAR
ncbi:MAG: universal stress protein [Verrucomicrobia bacterium]|nr:universal stress protein [Verrucomicrobiota bacterium]